MARRSRQRELQEGVEQGLLTPAEVVQRPRDMGAEIDMEVEGRWEGQALREAGTTNGLRDTTDALAAAAAEKMIESSAPVSGSLRNTGLYHTAKLFAQHQIILEE